MRSLLFEQDQAIDSIEQQIEIVQAGLRDEAKPPAVFFLYGPTGSGKTHTVEALAEAVHHNSHMYLRIDCGELQMDHEIAKIMGSPPGYMGHRETEPIITQEKLHSIETVPFPFSLLLLDEIEKSSRAFQRLLLAVLDKGRLRTNEGRMLDFTSTFIFMSSNIGSQIETEETATTSHSVLDQALSVVKEKKAPPALEFTRNQFRKYFAPEFINRLDCFIPYAPLSSVAADKILSIELDLIQARIVNAISEKTFIVNMTPEARLYLLKCSDTAHWGGREIKRVLQHRVTTVLAKAMVNQDYPLNGHITIDVKDDQIVLNKSASKTASMEDLMRAALITNEWRKRKDLKEL